MPVIGSKLVPVGASGKMHFGMTASFRRLQTASSGTVRGLASFLKPSLSYHGTDRWIVKGVKSTWLSVLSTILYDVGCSRICIAACDTACNK